MVFTPISRAHPVHDSFLVDGKTGMGVSNSINVNKTILVQVKNKAMKQLLSASYVNMY